MCLMPMVQEHLHIQVQIDYILVVLLYMEFLLQEKYILVIKETHEVLSGDQKKFIFHLMGKQ